MEEADKTKQVMIKKRDDYAVVYTQGFINETGGEKIAEECYRLMDEGYQHLVLNLEESRIINSRGVSMLIEIIERVGKIDGSLSFCNLLPTIAKTFRIMRLTEASEIYGKEEEAIDALVS